MTDETKAKKDYLRRYQIAHKKELHIIEDIRTVRGNAMLRARIMDGTTHGGSRYDLSDYAAKLDDLCRKYDDLALHTAYIENEIISAIHRLDDPDEISLLYFYYIKGMTQKEIAGRLGLNQTWACKRMRDAVEHFTIPDAKEVDERGFIKCEYE